MDLHTLGWHPHFDEAYASLKTDSSLPARVARQDKHRYLLLTTEGELAGQTTGRMRHESEIEEDLPVVGDWVVIEPRRSEQAATILSILPRRSSFRRSVITTRKGRARPQVLASNIDTAFLVSGLDGNFNPRRIERFVLLAYESGAVPVIVLNKCDLCDDIDTAIAEIEAVAIGVDIHAVSAAEGDGIENLRPYCATGQTVAFLGSSGVGKSTLINALLGEDRLKTTEVRLVDSKGRHTTTAREMIVMPDGGILIDTPGMRGLLVWSDGSGLEPTFGEIEALAVQCKFSDCQHETEPGCAVRAALKSGELDEKRFENWRKLQKEIRYLERRQNVSAALEEKAKWKKIAKLQREIERD
ncbi:ribosome small subunit-dependent GTPase A [bacterium]|nr:ribosome small subunit-dependent GTPase A [bacterium]